MRSRTSRGVPEWPGGKDLYMGSPVLVTGKVLGCIGNVPGPPGGSRGSTKWGHRWKYALEAIIKALLLYFLVHDNCLYTCYNRVIRKS
jgi:hypothetical protein